MIQQICLSNSMYQPRKLALGRPTFGAAPSSHQLPDRQPHVRRARDACHRPSPRQDAGPLSMIEHSSPPATCPQVPICKDLRLLFAEDPLRMSSDGQPNTLGHPSREGLPVRGRRGSPLAKAAGDRHGVTHDSSGCARPICLEERACAFRRWARFSHTPIPRPNLEQWTVCGCIRHRDASAMTRPRVRGLNQSWSAPMSVTRPWSGRAGRSR